MLPSTRINILIDEQVARNKAGGYSGTYPSEYIALLLPAIVQYLDEQHSLLIASENKPE